MKIDIPKFMLFVTMTTATAVAADSSSSTLARKKVTIEEEKSLLNNGEGAPTTTPPPPEEFAGWSLASSSSLTITDATTVSDSTLPAVGFGHPVTRGDRSSSKTGTRPHTVASDVFQTLPVDSGGRLSSTGMDASASNDVDNLYLHAVVDAINDNDEISSFTRTDGSDVSAPRKLIKSSKKVKRPEELCTLSLFADSLFLYANQCFTDIMVTISKCDDKDDTCYISERLPLLPHEEQEEQEENQEEEQCFVGGSFPAKQNIRYNPSTGDCEFLYVDLTDNPCNMYTGETGTGSLGLKARINVKNHPDVMFIQFTKDKGLTFYNVGDERVAKRSKTHYDRYLRQEGATTPVLSMMPHPFARGLFPYDFVRVKNDTPYEVSSIRVDYCACRSDENNFIASGGTWKIGTYRGGCLVQGIHATLRLQDGTRTKCASYGSSGGTGIATFYIMWIDGNCCLRSWKQSNTECTKQLDDGKCNPSEKNLSFPKGCDDNDCATPVWEDGCEACMCFNHGNAAWCDGHYGTYYDTYFEEHGENPWGDTDVKNRKCNTDFKDHFDECDEDWQCKKEFTCSSYYECDYD